MLARSILGDGDTLPTSVAVPGGVAFLTSSLERLNAAFREVISSGGEYIEGRGDVIKTNEQLATLTVLGRRCVVMASCRFK
jgi:hypothetical protein